MNISRRYFIGGAAALAVGPVLGATEGGVASVYETEDGRATDSVFVRRVYLDLVGRLPTEDEARQFVESSEVGKREALVEQLIASDSFADYWSMKFCDILRVKSEFPINLWPNAVYVYHRRIRTFVASNESWTTFARELLLSSGSDFREAAVNFYRATSQRTPEGFAEIAALTFLGEHWRERTGIALEELTDYFRSVRIKKTREWKEEVVQIEGEDRRELFCDRLEGDWHRYFAEAFVQRVDCWLLGRNNPDRSHVEYFLRNGLTLKALVKEVLLSDAYASGSVTGGFPCRRLDAEVLDDIICDLTGAKRDYQSIAPEPFTFLPPDRRTVLIEDGSVSNSFLTLFGRPARDTGLLSERHNVISPKQRLYLFNSGRIHNLLGKMVNADSRLKTGPVAERIQHLYWRFFARAPSAEESARLLARFKALPNGRERWGFVKDVAWAILNSREFLYQH